jgi:nicotinate dehydrogenase subunit A
MTSLRVNGTDHDVTTHPRAALLWALRDELGYPSAKYGCGVEQCGACRVLIDGAPAYACAIAIDDVGDRGVTTLEGLVADGRARPVVEAILAVDAGQCGYCLPGIVTTLTALKERSAAAPARREVLRALDDHLCRCGAHTRIVAAACQVLEVSDE